MTQIGGNSNNFVNLEEQRDQVGTVHTTNVTRTVYDVYSVNTKRSIDDELKQAEIDLSMLCKSHEVDFQKWNDEISNLRHNAEIVEMKRTELLRKREQTLDNLQKDYVS